MSKAIDIFKKNGEINLSNLSKFMGFNSQKLKSDLLKIKNSLTNEAKERNQRQYNSLILGGLAMYAGLTQKDLISMIREDNTNKEIKTELSRLKNTFQKVDALVKDYDNKEDTLKELQNAVLKLQDLSEVMLIEVEKLPIKE